MAKKELDSNFFQKLLQLESHLQKMKEKEKSGESNGNIYKWYGNTGNEIKTEQNEKQKNKEKETRNLNDKIISKNMTRTRGVSTRQCFSIFPNRVVNTQFGFESTNMKRRNTNFEFGINRN